MNMRWAVLLAAMLFNLGLFYQREAKPAQWASAIHGEIIGPDSSNSLSMT